MIKAPGRALTERKPVESFDKICKWLRMGVILNIVQGIISCLLPIDMPGVFVIYRACRLRQALFKQNLYAFSDISESQLKSRHIFETHGKGDSQTIFPGRDLVGLVVVQGLNPVFSLARSSSA